MVQLSHLSHREASAVSCCWVCFRSTLGKLMFYNFHLGSFIHFCKLGGSKETARQKKWLQGTANCRRQWLHNGPSALCGHLYGLCGAPCTQDLSLSWVTQNLRRSWENSKNGILCVSFSERMIKVALLKWSTWNWYRWKKIAVRFYEKKKKPPAFEDTSLLVIAKLWLC